jgi:hypothetical protein
MRRNQCIQVSEVQRKCKEEQFKIVTGCTGVAGSCNDTVRSKEARCLNRLKQAGDL